MISVLMELRNFETVLHRRIENAMPKHGDKKLFHVQALVLAFIKENKDKEICQKDVEQFLKVSSPSVTKLLQRMEERGLIVRTPSLKDKRVKRVEITEKAEKFLDFGLKEMNKAAKRLEDGISEQEKEIFAAVLKKLTDNSEAAFQKLRFPKKEELC